MLEGNETEKICVWIVHCGNYRKFRVLASSGEQAKLLFQQAYLENLLFTKGFTAKDITHIEKE